MTEWRVERVGTSHEGVAALSVPVLWRLSFVASAHRSCLSASTVASCSRCGVFSCGAGSLTASCASERHSSVSTPGTLSASLSGLCSSKRLVSRCILFATDEKIARLPAINFSKSSFSVEIFLHDTGHCNHFFVQADMINAQTTATLTYTACGIYQLRVALRCHPHKGDDGNNGKRAYRWFYTQARYRQARPWPLSSNLSPVVDETMPVCCPRRRSRCANGCHRRWAAGNDKVSRKVDGTHHFHRNHRSG